MHAAPDVLGCLHLDVCLHLLAELSVGMVPGENAGNTRERGANLSHGVSGRE
jgi:hypothetical protein